MFCMLHSPMNKKLGGTYIATCVRLRARMRVCVYSLPNHIIVDRHDRFLPQPHFQELTILEQAMSVREKSFKHQVSLEKYCTMQTTIKCPPPRTEYYVCSSYVGTQGTAHTVYCSLQDKLVVTTECSSWFSSCGYHNHSGSSHYPECATPPRRPRLSIREYCPCGWHVVK